MPCISSHDISSPRPAKGFTLVELLVSITILVILATVTLYGMASVQRTAQNDRARSQIQRIHELIAERWESYETRRIDLNLADIESELTVYGTIPDNVIPTVIEQIRVQAMRELIRRELPDRLTDLVDFSTVDPRMDLDYVLRNPPFNVNENRVNVRLPIPSAARFYHIFVTTRYRDDGNPSTTWASRYASAECLYMILSRINVGDATALEFFSENEIGDEDRDGLPELLDPWGNPIRFVRWPAGFTSFIQDRKPDTRGDSFDPARVMDDPANPDDAYYMFPLILSAGADGIPGIFLGAATGSPPVSFSLENDPYEFFSDIQLGATLEGKESSTQDNVYNHLLETGVN